MHRKEILESDVLAHATVVRSMKILIISSLYPPHVIGGAEKAAAELAEALVRRGHVVVVVSLHPESNEIVEDRNGVRVYRLPLDNFYWPFGRTEKLSVLRRLAWHIREMWNPVAARRLGKILDAEIPDVVNTHNVCGFSLAAWQQVKRRKLRLVHTLHDYYLMCPRCTLFDKGRNCEKRCLSCKVLTFNRRRLSRLPDSIVSVSRHALDEHIKRDYLEARPATVIYNIQSGFKSPPQQTPNGGHLLSDLVFGFIGRVEEEKGIETLLAATRQLRSSNWKLKIAGKGIAGYVDKLKRKFTDSRIEWLGFTDAAKFYASVNVVILPSLWAEPLPYVCVESLHAGKSLICASSGGIPEIARLARIIEFVPAGNANALAEKMSLALNSPGEWRESEVPDESRLTSFREEYVVDRYLQEYVSKKQELNTCNVRCNDPRGCV
jgi:glycosyltransferase involved in cell wall biosynthesis